MFDGSMVGFFIDIDTTTFEDFVATVIKNKDNQEYKKTLLENVPDNFYKKQNDNANDLKRIQELCMISNLHYHFNYMDFKKIMSKKAINYLSDYSYYIYKGDVSYNDYIEIIESRNQSLENNFMYIESELPYLMCLTTDNEEQETLLLNDILSFFKENKFKYGNYKNLIPNINIFYNNNYYYRLIKILTDNSDFLNLFNSLVGINSPYKLSFTKCFDFSSSIDLFPFNILLTSNEYNTILTRLKTIEEIYKQNLSDDSFSYLELSNYLKIYDRQVLLLNQEFINNIGADILDKHRFSPLQNIYRNACYYEIDSYHMNLNKIEYYNTILKSKENLEDMFEWKSKITV